MQSQQKKIKFDVKSLKKIDLSKLKEILLKGVANKMGLELFYFFLFWKKIFNK